MPDVRVTIDGIEISVPSNSTVLEAARRAGVNIPTLCDHPAIEPIGACRMCLVEIEKQRTLQPACTFPVFEGMVVQTRSEKVVGARQFVLQLLFSERNHFCMFCQMSGSCELQNLAYDYELDHWAFERPMPKFEVDASREFFAMDHNRCILCRRCVRVCDELVGNGTLGMRNRGADTMIIADLGVPFGESSCISCGTCLQVCPTGALMDRASAYMGATAQIERVKSTCMACPVGCGEELVVRDGRVIRVEGDWEAKPNNGLLCVRGRFDPLHDRRDRVRKPLVKQNGEWVAADPNAALELVSGKLAAAGDKVATIASGFVTVEEGKALADAVKGNKYYMYALPPAGNTATVADLDRADLYVAVGIDLAEDYQVAGMAVKRGVRKRGARLVLVGNAGEGMAKWAARQLCCDDLAEAAKLIQAAEHPLVIAGPEGLEAANGLVAAAPQARLLSFAPGGNGRGLVEAGYAEAFAGQAADVYVVAAGETANVDQCLLDALKKGAFVVVLASYAAPWDGVADVILPMPTSLEKSGTTVSVDGVLSPVAAAMHTRVGSLQDTVAQLAEAVR
ncbi:MAG: 2Fe-2S iron-sulfur cluster-binding protein [Anaerolineae bacterium]|jgi:formate dehydrogenase major subunit|nr:2Fe-2S iron-sulfur cluster binding domain-containing protein [Chloroflexota bacterium]